MALNFPNSPSLNDLHEENLTKWRWNGSSWIRVVTTSTAGAQGFQGAAGAQGATAAQGAQGDDGAQGAQGHQGATGSGAQGNTGAQGAQGAQGLNGNFGGASFEYTFLTNTTDSDPGAGSLKFNNSNLTSASILYIDDTDGGSSNTDIQPFLRTIDDSTSTIKGHVKVSTKTNPDQFVLYTIASLTEATGYFKVTVAYVSGSVTSFTNSSDISITFARTGDAGSTGAQGAQGHQGATGVGAQGAANTGAQGAQGHQGLQGAQAHISTSAPSSGVTVGDLWWESDTGDLSIYYDDGSGSPSAQWVEVGSMGPTGAQGAAGAQGDAGAAGAQGDAGGAGAQGATGSTGAQGNDASLTASTSAPGSPSAGDMWWDSDDGNLYVYYNDGSSSQWVSINTGVRGAQGATGAQGAQGAAGAQGAQGHQGHQGQTGAGAQGAAGAQGNAGAQGAQGVAGSATISGNANNRIITGGSGTNLVGESLLTFDGDTLHLVSSGGDDNNSLRIDGTNNTSGGQVHQFVIENRGESAWVNFKTSTANGSAVDRIRINSISGQVRIYNELYLTDDVPLYLGSSNDLSLFHQSGGASVIRYNHTVGSLYFRNNSNDDQAILNSSGEFGVGVSPLRKLHVKSGSNSNDGAFRVESAPGNIMDMGTDGSMHFLNCVSTDPFRIKFAGNEALRLTQETSGNWTTTLQFYMETNNGQGATPYIRGVAGTEAGGSDSENAGGLEFHTKTGGSGSDINAMRIDHNGRVSIGAHNIQNPTAALHIIGDTQGTNTALQVGQDSGDRYFRVNEVNGQSKFADVLLSFYDNSLAAVLKLQNTYAAAANFGTAIQFIGHGGSQTGKISVYNRDANSASNSIMELSASYVTKPNHPCFDANRTAGAVSSTSVIVYNVATTNNGNHYSTSNGRFTAPVTGYYQFWFGAIKQDTSGVVRLHMRKNGSTTNMNDGRQLRLDSHGGGDGTYGENGAVTLITQLTKDDYVQVVVTAGTAYGTGSDYTYFCGTLIG